MKKEKTSTKKIAKKKETTKKIIKPKYEGTVTYDAAILKEAMLSGKNFQRWSYFVILAVTTIEQIYYFISNPKDTGIALPIVAILICLYTMYNDFSKKGYKRQVEFNYGQEVRQKIEFFEDKIILTNIDFKNKRSEFNYNDVHDLYETKRLIVLVLKYNTGITLEKESLKTDIKDFAEFIYKQKNLPFKKVRKAHIINPFIFVGLLIINVILLVLSLIF